jgi:two-component system, OmpR family, sensor histidine kinase BaeS
VRAHLISAMIALALASVAFTALTINGAVDSELRELSQREVRFSAMNGAGLAAGAYLESRGWSERSVRAVLAVARARGDALTVLDADGRLVPGSPAPPPTGGERARVVVGGRQVGTVVAAHPATAGASGAAQRLDTQLRDRMDDLLLESGAFAGLLALLLALAVALRVARPLHRLTEVASRMVAGEIETRATGSGGGREMTKLAQTMDRLAAALRRQDELRRATVSDVSHELRGALVGVFARVEALRHGLVDDEDAVLRQIDSDAHRVHRLVEDVERLAEAQRPGLLVHKRSIDLAAIVRARVAGHADAARRRSIALRQLIAPARVDGDPERLAQVLDNLLSNALRYTDPGGRVLVRLGVRGGEALIEVSDSGIGIAPRHVERIFDRFWRAPEARSRVADGSGVGLALVSALVRAHDGRVEVDSRPGAGSTFRVLLPVREGPPVAAPPAPAIARGPVVIPWLARERADALLQHAGRVGVERPDAASAAR